MSTGTTSGASKRRPTRKILLGIIAIIVIVILLVPVALAGGVNVPVSKLTFNETTGSLAYSNVQLTTSIVTAYEYYFSIRAGGMVRTSDSSNVSSSGGTTNITISMILTNPSNQTIDLGKTAISGGIGTRSHTVYLSIDQGVRTSGRYKLDVTITANVSLLGVLQGNLSKGFQMNWGV